MDPNSAPRQGALKRTLLVLAGLEVLVFGIHYLRQDPKDLQSLFERMARHSPLRQRTEDLAMLAGVPIQDVEPLLVREATHSDPSRASVAVWLAYRLGVADSISPDARVRSLLAIEGEREKEAVRANPLDHSDYALFAEALSKSSPNIQLTLLKELTSGRMEARWLIAAGLGRSANNDLIAEMHRYLLEATNPAQAWPILTAFAARTDLPISRDQDLWPIYRRHLPGILDPKTKEAKWIEAVRLARELPPPDPFSSYDLGCGALPPAEAPIDSLTPASLAKASRVAWPMTDEDADHWEKRVHEGLGADAGYDKALLVRWHRTGSWTLPYFPYEAPGTPSRRMDSHPFQRTRRSAQARRILDPSRFSPPVRWTCGIVGTGSRAEPGRLLQWRSGIGVMSPIFRVALAGTAQVNRVRLGVRPSPQGPGLEPADKDFLFDHTFYLERIHGGYRVEGMAERGADSGNGGEALQAFARTGEAVVLQIETTGGGGSRGPFANENYQQCFELAWLETIPENPPLNGWRTAIARSLDRWAGTNLNLDVIARREDPSVNSWDLRRMLQLTSWIHVPEARGPLRKLWERRSEWEPSRIADAFSHADWISASLLMTGDDDPLADASLAERLTPEIALRIFMFSPNLAVWAGMDKRAVEGVHPSIAEAVVEHLAGRGDGHSQVATRARSHASSNVAQSLGVAGPTLLIAAVLLAFAWMPIPRMSRETFAASLVITGLILQFVTIEVGGRLWLPLLGDLLWLATAILLARAWLIALTGLLAVTGFVQFFAPAADWGPNLGLLLVALFLGWLSLDEMDRIKPMSKGRGFAHLAMWMTMIVPAVVVCVSSLLPPRLFEQPPLFQMKGAWAMAYVAVMFLSPMAIAFSWRRSLLPTPLPNEPAEAATS